MKGAFEKHQQLSLFEKEQEQTQEHDEFYSKYF